MSARPARVLLTPDQIAARVRELGRRIADDLGSEAGAGGREVTLIPILTGSIVFVADLIREIPLMMSLRLVTVSSYPGASLASKGARLRGELPGDLAGKHVLIVDDILDSGGTLGLVRSLVGEQGPASLRACVLLRKAVARPGGAEAEYVGFDIPDEFVVGYGLDYDGYYRNQPHISVLSPADVPGAGVEGGT